MGHDRDHHRTSPRYSGCIGAVGVGGRVGVVLVGRAGARDGDGVSATRAFDLALFVPVPANVNDGVVVSALGPPFATQFKPLVVGSQPGVTVGASMPAANAQNQILISGPGPSYAWALGTNPAAAASVPPATAQHQVIMSDAALTWQDTTIDSVMALGNAVTTTLGGTFVATAKLVFATSAVAAVRIDGGDPTLSIIDNVTIDCGTF